MRHEEEKLTLNQARVKAGLKPVKWGNDVPFRSYKEIISDYNRADEKFDYGITYQKLHKELEVYGEKAQIWKRFPTIFITLPASIFGSVLGIILFDLIFQ